MKKLIFILSIVLIGFNANSQGLTINSTQLNFASTFENAADSQFISIKNNTESNIVLKEFRFYAFYNSYPFYVKQDTLNILANDSAGFYIYFKPLHNVLHNAELFVITEPSIYSFSIDLKGQGKYSKTYYNSTENKSEEDLKASIKTLVAQGYVSLGYNTARDKMFMEIDNKFVNGQGAGSNTLECVYTGKLAFGYTDRTSAQTNFNFNTEHTFPQGFFSQNEPMRSDLHHLFPTNDAANNSRNNFAFGVATLPYQNDATNTPSHLGSNSIYEPRDTQKGRTARAMMYFVLRYQDYTNFFATQESILRQWNATYPPNAVDIARNNAIQLVQKNRNPFVDYPQLADRIQKIVGTSTAPVIRGSDYIKTITTSELIDTNLVYHFEIPYVNTGNTSLTLTNFKSTDAVSHLTLIADTIQLAANEATKLSIDIQTTDTSGLIIDSILFLNNGQPEFFIIKANIKKTITIGFDSNIPNSEIQFYPNPVFNQAIIQLKSNNYVNAILLIDVLGKTHRLSFEKIDSKNLLIDLSPFHSGIYWLSIKSNQNTIQNLKIIKN